MARASIEEQLEQAREAVHADPSDKNIKAYKALAAQVHSARQVARTDAPPVAVGAGDVAVRPDAVAGGISVQPEEGE